ncbi:hypothetical protein [Nocardia sp. XZ_19_369]|uniref:hypothetical protein n=1 Tax=Nocardia sp. XZ_19_369 TaxID=2769487 RepID=UPI00188F38E8|nr:hypothetical protein [Nocardia sp. XZ_19_369]
MAQIRGFAAVTALPLAAAALVAGPAAVATADLPPPEWPSLGEIVSGSAAPGGIDTGSADSGTPLQLGPSGGPAVREYLGTGSVGLGTGTRAELGTGTGEIDDTVSAAPVQTLPGGSAELPDLDSDGVRTACTGSVAVGGALILLGIVTGSSHGILGSSGSALGSVVVGSAATGSGLACLLWPRDILPPYPGNPLLLPPPLPTLPTLPALPDLPAPPAEIPPTPELTPATPSLPSSRTKPRPTYSAEAELILDPVAWNPLQLVTIMVVTILTAVRGVAVVRRRHSG